MVGWVCYRCQAIHSVGNRNSHVDHKLRCPMLPQVLLWPFIVGKKPSVKASYPVVISIMDCFCKSSHNIMLFTVCSYVCAYIYNSYT